VPDLPQEAAVTTSLAPTVPLAHGAAIPAIGLGTWPMTGDEATTVIAQALQMGYRSIDTAEKYGNEEAVGAGLRASGVRRDEVFLTTKFNAEWHRRDLVPQAFRASATRLGVDYIDLMLIHWPNPWLDRYVDAWEGLLDLREKGDVRAIGTSNFKPAHIDRLLAKTGEAPELNQIQLDPALARAQTRAYHTAHRIVTGSWSPLGRRGALLDNPVITDVADRYGRTPAQVVLRWHIELGCVPVPKSADPDRLAANLHVFDFQLTPDEIASITSLDRGEDAARDSEHEGH
jgi:2,5-diketo-D-gluconate reductase A